MDQLKVIPWFVKRVYIGGVNQRNVFTLALNFCVNFAPVFIWLAMFKNAGIVPNSWRPRIMGNLAFYCDEYMFGDFWRSLETRTAFLVSLASSSVVGLLLFILPLLMWYRLYYTKKIKHNVFDQTDLLLQYPMNGSGATQFRPSRLRNMCPFLFPIFMFLVLNLDHLLSSQDPKSFTKFKDLLAWVLYVILHLTAPILTAVYLYVFQVPGTLKCFSFALGLQNIVGLCTHILLPMAPPWFIHMYGIHDTAHLNYDQPGYAAGLTRVDMHLGTHLNSNGFHMSPIVFGAVPSLHSAMAVQCFFFLLLRSTQTKSIPDSIARASSNEQNAQYHEMLELSQSSSDDDLSPERVSQGQIGVHNSVEHNQKASDALLSLQIQEDNDKDPVLDSMDEEYDKNAGLELSEISLPTYSKVSDLETLEESRFGSESSVYSVASAIAVQQRLPVHILESKWLYIFHKGILPRLLGTLFVCFQWWSTQYLDHHFRFDLFVGAIYASVSYCVINAFVLQPRVIKPWLLMRADADLDTKNEAKTMGMRVFEGTALEWFFDPLA